MCETYIYLTLDFMAIPDQKLQLGKWYFYTEILNVLINSIWNILLTWLRLQRWQLNNFQTTSGKVM